MDNFANHTIDTLQWVRSLTLRGTMDELNRSERWRFFLTAAASIVSNDNQVSYGESHCD